MTSAEVLLKNSEPSLQNRSVRGPLIAAAWALMLLVSDLPDIIWKGAAGREPGWLLWGKVGVVIMFLGLCLLLKFLRPLWRFAVVLAVLFSALGASAWVWSLSRWQSLFQGRQTSFALYYGEAFVRDLGVAAAVIIVLWMVKGHRKNFFLTKGNLAAPIRPVAWLGIRQGESWRTFGWIFAVAAGLLVAVPTVIGLPLSQQALGAAAPLLPAVLLFAAVNAFTEEVYFRASLLSTLTEVIGPGHALLINAVFFGLAHYLYGSPSGIPGFLMTGFLGWLLGKSMLETNGLLWPWFIHFVPDVVVFASYAFLWIQR